MKKKKMKNLKEKGGGNDMKQKNDNEEVLIRVKIEASKNEKNLEQKNYNNESKNESIDKNTAIKGHRKVIKKWKKRRN